MKEPSSPSRRSAISTKVLVIQVMLILAIPVLLGVIIGWYGLDPPQAERFSSIGQDSHLLLDGFPDSSLVVEVDYSTSVGPPSSNVVATLVNRIGATCTKSSITVQEFPLSSMQSTYSDADLLNLALSARHVWPSWGTMSILYLYLSGGYVPAPSVIGLAFRASSIAVFEGTIQTVAGFQADAISTTVMVHEFGHEIGLVGIIGSAPNEDPNHPYHSNDSSDVMYWQVDTTSLLGLGGGPPTQFDTADLSDLQSVRSTIIASEVIPWIVLGAVAAVDLFLVVRFLRRRKAG